MVLHVTSKQNFYVANGRFLNFDYWRIVKTCGIRSVKTLESPTIAQFYNLCGLCIT